MSNKDIYMPLLAFSKAYSDILKPLNLRAMSFFSSDAMTSALKSISSIKDSLPKATAVSSIQQELNAITHSYTQLIGAYDFGRSFSDALRPVIADLQVSTMLQLSQSLQTPMIHDLGLCFANAQYSGLVEVLNHTLACPRIEAPDIAFLKTSKLVDAIRNELDYPNGFVSSLNSLNKSTAASIADSNDIKYDTERNLFLSTSGDTNSHGLNVICSGKEILTLESGEIFTASELIDFMSLLSSTPMLAFSVETGRKIYGFLKELFFNGEKTIGFDKKVYYHCRSRKCDSMPFTYDQMLKAPHGLPWAGRFNQVGRSSYYFADSRNGAEAEIKKHKANNDVLQTVMLLPRKGIKLLDLSGSLARGTTFLRYIRFSLSDNTDKMPREYLIPCYVSDCCKALGFDGIKYYGSKEYNNYVAWCDGYFDYGGMCE